METRSPAELDAAAQEWIHGGELGRVLMLEATGQPSGAPIDMAAGARRIKASIAAGTPTPAARALLAELAAAPAGAPDLYRGVVMAKRVVRGFRAGRPISLAVGSWSTSRRVASGFADASPGALEWRANVRFERLPGSAVGVLFTLSAGARALRLVDLLRPGAYRAAVEGGLDRDPLDPTRPYSDPAYREYLAAGEFAIVGVDRSRHLVSVRLEQGVG